MKKLLKKWPIDHLNDNIVEKLKVSLIEQFLDNIIYESNHLNVDFNDLPFDGDEGVITRWRIYYMKDNNVFRLNNGVIVSR